MFIRGNVDQPRLNVAVKSICKGISEQPLKHYSAVELVAPEPTPPTQPGYGIIFNWL